MAKRVVVTGGLGFIGSHIARGMAEAGHDVVVVDAPGAPVRPDVAALRIERADITDPASLEALRLRADAVMHLAAQSSGPASMNDPATDVRLNQIGTLNVLDWCRRNEVPRLLFASSFVVYGDDPAVERFSEDAVPRPKSYYAVSKLACEHILRIWGQQHGLRWNVLRMFNVYGPGQDLRRTDQGMVAIFMSKVLTGDYVGVQGRLDRFRDLVYVDDVVQGWRRCLEDEAHPNEVYNVASGVKTEIGALIEAIVDACGKRGRVKVEVVGSTPGDIKGAYADIAKIRDHLGYAPAHGIADGVRRMAAWAGTQTW